MSFVVTIWVLSESVIELSYQRLQDYELFIKSSIDKRNAEIINNQGISSQFINDL